MIVEGEERGDKNVKKRKKSGGRGEEEGERKGTMEEKKYIGT